MASRWGKLFALTVGRWSCRIQRACHYGVCVAKDSCGAGVRSHKQAAIMLRHWELLTAYHDGNIAQLGTAPKISGSGRP